MRLLTAIRKSEQAAAKLWVNEGRWLHVVRWEKEYQGVWYTTEIHQYNKRRILLSIINHAPVNRHQLKDRLGIYDTSTEWECY